MATTTSFEKKRAVDPKKKVFAIKNYLAVIANACLFVGVLFLNSTLLAEEKTVDEWIETVQSESVEQLKEWTANPALKQILLGGSICASDHPGKDAHGNKVYPPHAEAITVFKSFMAKGGEALLKSWMDGKKLAQSDAVYEPLFYALYLSMHAKKHQNEKDRTYVPPFTKEQMAQAAKEMNSTQKEGQAIAKRALDTRKLSSEDIASLRLWHIATATRCTGGIPYMPFELGLTDMQKASSKLGIEAPDFQVRSLLNALESKNYSDIPDLDFPMLAPFRKDGILEILYSLRAFNLDASKKRVELSDWHWKNKNEGVRLSDFKGKKPVVLIMADATDCFIPLAFNELEPVYQTYKDRVEFMFINVTIHDLHMSPKEYFKQSKEGYDQAFVGHPYSDEERARSSKNLHMRFAHVSIPSYIDDVGSSANALYASNGGSASIRLIDLDGKLADLFYSPFCGTIWANELERSICQLLANKGKRGSGDPDAVAPYKAAKDKPKVGFSGAESRNGFRGRERVEIQLVKALVKAVDKTKESVVIEVKAKKASASNKHTLNITKWTRIQSSDGKMLSLDQLSVNDKVDILYWADQRFEPPIKMELVKPDYTGNKGVGVLTAGGLSMDLDVAGGEYSSDGWPRNTTVGGDADATFTPRRISPASKGKATRPTSIFLCGTIQEINSESRVITVKQDKPDPTKLLGYKFNVEAKDRAVLLEDVADRQKVVSRWLSLSDSQLMRKIRIDDGVELIKNGAFDAQFKDLKTGDRVGVEYYTDRENEAVINPEKIRISSVSL